MWIIGVDYHPSVQQIAFTDTETGECGERRLNHSDGEVRPRLAHCLESVSTASNSRTSMEVARIREMSGKKHCYVNLLTGIRPLTWLCLG